MFDEIVLGSIRDCSGAYGRGSQVSHGV